MAQGFVSDGYQPIAEAFDSYFTDGLDDGASLAVYHHGKAVIDLWGGAGPNGGPAWEKDSVGIVFSVTKGATAIMILQLMERGLLDIDAPVARYWPEFGAAGKSEVTIRQVMQHREALPYLDADVSAFLTPGAAESILAEQSPSYPINSAFNYHPVTYGTILGEVIRRVSGKPVGEYFAEQIAGPLGLDFWIGLPESAERQFREVTYLPIEVPALPPAEVRATFDPAFEASVKAEEQLYSWFAPEAKDCFANRRQFRAAALAGASGVSNARSLARMYAALLSEVDGVRLLSEETVAAASALGTADIQRPPMPDGTAQDQPYFGLGFQVHPDTDWLGLENSFGHAGIGGRVGFADAKTGLAVGYVGQRMNFQLDQAPDPRTSRLADALRQVP